MSKARQALKWDVYKPRYWGHGGRARALPRPWYALDTERDSKTGEFICGWIVGPDTRRINFLLDGPPGTYWIYNLAYDLEGMLRDYRDSTAWAARADGAPFEWRNGLACYYHGKRFDYQSDAGKWSFLEAAAFNNRMPLHTLGAKESMDASQMSLKMYRENARYERVIKDADGKWVPSGEYGNYAEDVDKYCIIDAKIVQDFIEGLATGLSKIGIEMGATPGSTARRFLSGMPPFPEIIWRTHKAFLQSYCGGRFEICKRGILHDVKQYDIVSAYPWALAQCPWLTPTAYSRTTRRMSDSALYGSYLVQFSQDSYLGVAPRWKHNVRVYSAEEDATWLTRPEVLFLQEIGARYEILRGVEIWDENALPLWRDAITRLFEMKQSGEFGRGPKVILNSEYGILIQLVRKSGTWVPIGTAKNPVDFAGLLELEAPPEAFEGGKYYAPVYAGNLTALTRVKILKAALDTGDEHYIGGHTDSVLTTGKLRIGLGEGLGDWKLEETAPIANISKTGMYSIGNKVKIRGITRKGNSEMLWSPELQRRARIGIKQATSWDEVSCIVPKAVANNFTIETKRQWDAELTRGLIAMQKHIDSRPWRRVTV